MVAPIPTASVATAAAAKPLARLFLELVHGPELEPRQAHRLGGVQAAAGHQGVGALLDVERQFVGHLLLERRSTQGVPQEPTQASERAHHASSASSAVFIAAAARCQRSVSAPSRLRPAAVSR